jgi:hypothetical protein
VSTDEMRRLAMAFLVGAGLGLGCARLSAPGPAPEPRVTVTLVVRNATPVALDVYYSRFGWADVWLDNVRPYRTDTVITAVPNGAAFKYLAASPEDWSYRRESVLIYAIAPIRFDWQILPPLSMRQRRAQSK